MSAALLHLASLSLPRHVPLRAERHAAMLATDMSPIQAELVRLRRIRRVGVLAGGGLLAGAAALGIGTGVLDAPAVALPCVAAGGAALFYTRSHDEHRPPLADSCFLVQPSLIPGAGMGLFAAATIPAGAFLFEYTGDRLTEGEYYERYPTGQGRYVAEVATLGAPMYIDGATADGGVAPGWARWMNSQPEAECNVRKRKQRFGPMRGRMFLYAACAVEPGDELTFDYGRSYWDAVAAAEAAEAQEQDLS
eukprot:scaffold18597_cov100-Isochrysis_galbana.AAC.3